ncbi:hypothetical protein [Nonomuraea salmonea]|uniref:hypothetical protein n=1 Tax=Nonomuraea salmonea TaxID=46181 RepID=UPI002FEB6BCD
MYHYRCALCHAAFPLRPSKSRGQKPRFCSTSCRQRVHRAKEIAAREKAQMDYLRKRLEDLRHAAEQTYAALDLALENSCNTIDDADSPVGGWMGGLQDVSLTFGRVGPQIHSVCRSYAQALYAYQGAARAASAAKDPERTPEEEQRAEAIRVLADRVFAVLGAQAGGCTVVVSLRLPLAVELSGQDPQQLKAAATALQQDGLHTAVLERGGNPRGGRR